MSIEATPLAALRGPGELGQTLTANQIGCVLNDIAQSAMQMDALIVRLQASLGGDDLSVSDALAGAVLAMAQRVGWAADMAADRIPGSCGAAFGDAARWMMPPSFHWDDEARKPAGGGRDE